MNIQEISLNKIKLGENSRLQIGESDLEGLMQAIKSQGLLQPVGVIKKGSGYELCYGNRRFLACSKLGWSKITCVIIDPGEEYSRDLKNLTENVQRKNISLIEVGRFIKILKKQDLTQGEIALRMGVAKSFVVSCERAFDSVPVAHRNDIEMVSANKAVSPGKVSLKMANEIMNQQKSIGLTQSNVDLLFKAAKSQEGFKEAALPQYARSLKAGHKDFIKRTNPPVAMRLTFLIPGPAADKLKEKFIENGPFKSLSQLMIAILKGEKSVKVEMI